MIISYSLSSGPPKRFETESDAITFGRNPSPDQHVDVDLTEDEFVSRVHAVLTYEHGEYWIEDLDSVNGTWVDGKEVRSKKKRLNPGQELQVGYTVIEIEMMPAPVAPEQDVPTPAKGLGETAPQFSEPAPNRIRTDNWDLTSSV
ncbi:FHA domain-containing protein [Thermodesulfobacteriota bacterium]